MKLQRQRCRQIPSRSIWADSVNSKNAVKQGAKIMMSPAAKSYMDMQYDSTTRLGLHWAAYIEVDQAYNWNPATLVTGIKEKILLVWKHRFGQRLLST
jgi:hexosaminidase